MNSKLKPAGMTPLAQLVDGFTDGIAVAKVLELLTGNRVKIKSNAKLAALKLDNLLNVFKAVDKAGILEKTDNFAAKDFFDGNEKMIVAFCFKLILKYDMPRSGKMLLKWMKRRIEPFGYTLDIDDPCPSVCSGKEFMALVASQRPDFCEADKLDDSMTSDQYNDKAFDYLEKEFGVIQLLEPEDVSGCEIDDMQLILYLAKVKEAFDAEQPDVEPESLAYPGAPFEFAVGQPVPTVESNVPPEESPMLPVVEPEGECENLLFAIEPALPAGLEMDSATGIITGTPEVATDGEQTFTVNASNSAGEVTCEIVVLVKDVPPTSISYGDAAYAGENGVELSIDAPTVDPAGIPLKFTISPELPAGLSLNEENGAISGTPEDISDETYTVTASNTGGEASTEVKIAVTDVPPSSIEYEEMTLVVGTEASIAPTVQNRFNAGFEAGPSSRLTFAQAPDSFLVFDSSTGVFSGTPGMDNIGEHTVTVTVSNSGGEATCDVKMTVIEVCPTAINYDTDTLIATVGQKAELNPPTVEPEGTAVHFTIEPPLPEGLELEELTGAIIGIPVSPCPEGTHHTITATNTGGSAETGLNVVIQEEPPTALSYPDGPNLTCPMETTVMFPAEVLYGTVTEGSGKFSIEPALPDGLELDEETGVISGTIVDPALFKTQSQHVVTVKNTGGEVSTEVTIDCIDEAREFFEHVDAHADDYVSRLKEIVDVPSISCDPEHSDDTAKALRWYQDWAKKLGGEVQEVMLDEPNKPGVLQITFGKDPNKKTVCTYGHLDVQPVERSNWSTDPFDMSEEEGKLFGRGTSASKGPTVSWLWVVEAYQELGKELPVNVKILVDCMKEIGSPGLDNLVKEASAPGGFLGDVDYFCVSANSWLGRRTPCVTYGLRGLCHFACQVSMGSKDLHSGHFGGTVHEPMTDLAMLMGKLLGPDGKMLIPGVYDTVTEWSAEESAAYDAIDFDLKEYVEDLGLTSADSLAHDNKKETLGVRWRTPCLSIHGIEGAFSDLGRKTVIPHRAVLKFSIRLTPGMEPKDVCDKMVGPYLKEAFAGFKSGNQLDVTMTQGCRAWLEDPSTPHFEAAKAACKMVHKVEADLTREGASVPITVTLSEATGKSVCMLPIGASDDNAASANEKLNRSNYTNGIKVMGMYLQEVAKL